MADSDDRELKVDAVLPGDPRRELQEIRALAIKTNNLTSTLNAEVKAIARRLDHRERLLTLNSAVVYILFAVILGGGLYVIHRVRVERADLEKDGALREAAVVREELAQVRKRDEERRRGEEKAYELYQLLRGGRARESLARYPDVSRERLSRTEADVLRDAVARGRQDLGYAAFEAGRQAYGAGQWKRATQDFKRAVEIDAAPPHAAQLYYLYGISLYKLGDYLGAATQLERAIEKGAERTVQHDAGFYLAAAHDQAKKRDRAKAEYKKFMEKHPKSQFFNTARRRLVELEAGR